MSISEITAKSLLQRAKKVDSWFVSGLGMNLYRGCLHNCVYCDGRSEKYNVRGEFGRDIDIKTNAIELLRRELDPKRKRKPLKKSYICLSGGVSDCYQPLEERYGLTRKALEVIAEYQFPVHILTKSSLVERDIDLLKMINEKTRAIVSFSFSSLKDEIAKVFEPQTSLPSERLTTMMKLKAEGIHCGIFLMPVIPLIADSVAMLNQLFEKARRMGVDFVVFSNMTLKDGKQKDYFMTILRDYREDLISQYQILYPQSKYGEAIPEYYQSLNETVLKLAAHHGVGLRVPPRLYNDILDQNDLVMVILEGIDYLLKLRGVPSPYGYAAYAISQLKEPLGSIKKDLRSLKGVGKTTESLILEILRTGSCSYYERLYSYK